MPHPRCLGAIVFAILGAALSLAACSDSSSDAKGSSSSCPVGSEGCPCTAGMGCDVGLVCFDPICFKPDAAASGGGGGSSGAGGAAGSAFGGGGGTSSGGTSSGGTSSGGTSGGAPTCPFPGKATTASEVSDTTGQSKDKLPAQFTNGALSKLDGKACSIVASPPALAGDWGSYPCHDAYDCGGCLVYVVSPATSTTTGNWFLLGANSATYGATPGCPEMSGTYNICAPNCAGKVCGADGCNGSCGACGSGQCCDKQDKCVNDPCAYCLDSCKGMPGCCMGAGCICDSACPGPC